ncbi:hypothetical protein GMD78_05710 [Ornithinibacillus sp. L9]|uniref:DUF4367 domain-containing protein n=1 Tax=Ornithinibacillus caprae TaxID=2678566 RepID=A0A6N8FI11_9BACI|nr:hypothetical protein [Ornithinibacillus caprae]MUK87894.1 hypothetical protein [Ornithinibacillus caprae]
MVNPKKVTLVFVTMIIFIYAFLAIIETIHISSSTVDEAFEKFINSEFKTESARDKIGDKASYRYDDYAIIPFEVGNDVSLVQFKKGLFGWKIDFYSHNSNKGYSYSSMVDESSGEILLHGVIPRDIVTSTKNIKVNGIDADIFMLNDKAGIWLMTNNKNKENFDNIKIDFIDEVDNVIGEM